MCAAYGFFGCCVLGIKASVLCAMANADSCLPKGNNNFLTIFRYMGTSFASSSSSSMLLRMHKKTAHKICTRQAANIRSFNNEIMLYFIQIIYGIVCKRVFVFKPQKHYFRWSDIAVWLCPLNKMHIYKSILCPVVFFSLAFRSFALAPAHAHFMSLPSYDIHTQIGWPFAWTLFTRHMHPWKIFKIYRRSIKYMRNTCNQTPTHNFSFDKQY